MPLNMNIIKFQMLILFLVFLSACQQTPIAENALPPPNTSEILISDADLLAALNQSSEEGYLPTFRTTHETLQYTVVEQLEVVNQGPGLASKNNIWVALIRTIPPYQTVTAVSITPTHYTLVTDEYNNLYAEFNFDGLQPGEKTLVKLEYQIEINRVDYVWDTCEGDLLEMYTAPELHIESNNAQIISLAQSLTGDALTPCERARIYYDYAGDELVYTYNAGDWGAQATLGDMGADCTEYASLFIALCRSSGIPARYIEGLNYRGIHDDVEARLEHAWTEVYLPEIGWVPVDPTLGRLATTRERYFGTLPADHIIVTIGRHPSTLRGNHYFAHLYWGSTNTTITVENYSWQIENLKK